MFFFLIFHVFLCLRNVKREMLGVLYLVVNRILLNQMFLVFSKICILVFICIIKFSKAPKKYFVS